jgi:phosphoglucosamine mutase
MELFGTDGIRFLVSQNTQGDELKYSPELTLKIAKATSRVMEKGNYVVVWDTRKSSLPIVSIFSGVLASQNFNIGLAGILPTPAASLICRTLKYNGAFSISASHNPPEFNGIKFFNNDGLKLDQKTEKEIEKFFLELENQKRSEAENSYQVGELRQDYEFYKSIYKSFILNLFPKNMLKGLKIVLDCSNGSTSNVAPEIFRELGAKLKPIGVNPDGENINLGIGSENPQKALSEDGDFKIIFDGDGDRVLIGDSKGNLYDGDHLISILAKSMMEKGELRWGIVGTILSNMALEKFAKENKLNFARVDVGDRNIAYKMKEVGANLGGEESGHIILYDILPTGDGIISALKVLEYVIKKQKDLKDLAIEKFHQAKGKIKISQKKDLNSEEFRNVWKIKEEVEKSGGRVVVRYSGTEPVIRVMVEHENKEKAEEIKDKIEEELKKIFINNEKSK